MIKSPMNYTSGKFKLLDKILPLFPNDIDTFYDLFCGGCNVTINTNANKYICNDIESHIIDLYNYFLQHNTEYIINELLIDNKLYNLNRENKEGFVIIIHIMPIRVMKY